MSKVLVVDDDLATLEMIECALEEMDHTHATADTPEEFEKKLVAEHWDAVVIDAELPRDGKLSIDVGLGLARTTRHKYADLPILIITAYKEEEKAIRLCVDEICNAESAFKPLGFTCLKNGLDSLFSDRPSSG